MKQPLQAFCVAKNRMMRIWRRLRHTSASSSSSSNSIGPIIWEERSRPSLFSYACLGLLYSLQFLGCGFHAVAATVEEEEEAEEEEGEEEEEEEEPPGDTGTHSAR